MPVTKIRREQLRLTLQDLIWLDDNSGGSRTVQLGLEGLKLISDFLPFEFRHDGLFVGYDPENPDNGIKITNYAVLWRSGSDWVEYVKDINAGDGIWVTRHGGGFIGIINTDKGSSQNIFKNIKLGTSTATASSNNDTFEFVAGIGIGLSLDTANKKLTISVAGPTARTDTAQTWTATQTFNNGFVLPSGYAKGITDLGFDLVNISSDGFYSASSPTRYKSWNGTIGYKFKFANANQVLVFLNGQLLTRGSFTTTGWTYGDYAWEDDSSGFSSHTKVLALREQPVAGDLITVVGLFDSIFY